MRHSSLSDNLHQHPLAAAAVELAVENLLPGAEVQFAVGDRHHHFPAHDLPLQVGVGVVLAGVVVAVLGNGGVGRQLFQPDIIVPMQTGFIVIDEDAGGDVHSVAQDQTLFDAAFPEALFHLRGDVDQGPAPGDLKPQFLAIALHSGFPVFILRFIQGDRDKGLSRKLPQVLVSRRRPVSD